MSKSNILILPLLSSRNIRQGSMRSSSTSSQENGRQVATCKVLKHFRYYREMDGLRNAENIPVDEFKSHKLEKNVAKSHKGGTASVRIVQSTCTTGILQACDRFGPLEQSPDTEVRHSISPASRLGQVAAYGTHDTLGSFSSGKIEKCTQWTSELNFGSDGPKSFNFARVDLNFCFVPQ